MEPCQQSKTLGGAISRSPCVAERRPKSVALRAWSTVSDWEVAAPSGRFAWAPADTRKAHAPLLPAEDGAARHPYLQNAPLHKSPLTPTP
ncbi:hypothetical protein CfE428DRAFT_2582 [Chthoniobacter flavus Ellin428]|uniref:Uncharacterized protein n=1 Tax=Chthoniobacter flavus Ellin428 TaxID=497964 RepID=B4D0Y1_9BACT|nr:hypothetical protein CfE428DRAFT_2582 [Chthoniobacter flavus Ellin428]